NKSLYRPGETVKFRFVALTRRNILPFPESATWSSYQGVGEYWSEKTVVRLEPEVQKRRVDASYFDLIEIKDPLGNTDSKQLIPKNKCKSNHESSSRQWMLLNGVIDRTLCANMTTNIINLIGGKPPSSNDKLGWTGPNCLTPVCNEGCAKGGICVAPNRCTCKPGWNGESCEICVARSGCRDGDCVKGQSLRETTVDIGKMTAPGDIEMNASAHKGKKVGSTGITDSTPRRTVFKHVANLEFDSDFGPELRAVVFISIEGKIASDYLQIENIPSCSSPALPESSQNGGGLQFSEKVATPGKLVTMTLNLLHGHADGDSIYGTCILSTIKVTIKNFDIAAM
ncbi:unnamed protein product, partial [Hymenolepis diminuta]|uniref:EGF-like domain-containing protein n=1 Tax=Hymenolepis diminuta TaxID=6216 RepID=A0A0R3SZ88_HYMDI